MPNHLVLLLPLILTVACQSAGTQAQTPPGAAPVTPPASTPPTPTPAAPTTPPAATPTPQPTPPATSPAPTPPAPTPTPPASTDIYAQNRLLARTVNFGNALEAPNEGDWGMTLQEGFFQLVKDAGFSAIRLPVKWSAHAGQSAPYTLDPAFLERVRWAVGQATSRNLAIIVDFHHYDELITAPEANRERFLGIWKNVAEAFRDAPDNMFFELHNEPNGALEPLWNDYLAQALQVVRASNPERAVVVGPNGWNSAWRLPDLQLPVDDHLIVTFHDYEPFNFTHQGAAWVNPVMPTGVTWPTPGAAPAAGWQNWSWNTALGSAGDTALSVTYQQGWAGLYLHSDPGAAGYSALRLQTDRAVKLRVLCLEHNQQGGNPPGAAVETQAGVPLTIDFKECGGGAALHDLMIQSNVGEAQPAFALGTLAPTGSGGSLNLIGNARTALAAPLDFAAAWGKVHNRPLFMGEFGAYEQADLDSRARWTTAMRQEAEARGVSWGYWEFGAGFGVYDRAARAWRQPLLRALIP